MPALSSADSTIEIRTAEAVRAFLAQVAGLTTVEWRRADDPRERPLPIGVTQADGMRQEWAGSDEFAGVIVVMYESGKDSDADGDGIDAKEADLVANQAAHMAIVAKIANALADQEAMRDFLNAGAANRPCEDFHFYGSVDHEEPATQRMDQMRWNTTFQRRIFVARVDYTENGEVLVDEDGATVLPDEDDTNLVDE